jgi:hypothetical protein
LTLSDVSANPHKKGRHRLSVRLAMSAWRASAKANRRFPVKLERYAIEAMHVVMNSADMGRNGRDEQEEARAKTGIQQGRGHGDERGVKPACDRDRRSVEILRDLGLSTEKIVAYQRRFPTPTHL